MPKEVWLAATQRARLRPGDLPAYDPVRWERFFNLDYASLGVITDCTQAGWDARRAMGADPEGGFYSNRDNAYIYAHTSRKFGEVLMLEGKLPTTPRTYEGQKRMGKGQLRYWSVCQNESRVTTRAVDCLADRQVPLRGDRRYTIVVTRPEDRPSNATRRCGVGWVDWGERGDGGRPPRVRSPRHPPHAAREGLRPGDTERGRARHRARRDGRLLPEVHLRDEGGVREARLRARPLAEPLAEARPDVFSSR